MPKPIKTNITIPGTSTPSIPKPSPIIPPFRPSPPTDLVKELSDNAGDTFRSFLEEKKKMAEGERMKEAWAELKKMLDHDWGLDDPDYFEPVKRMMKEIEKKFELE